MELSPCDRMFHAPLLNCHILSIIGLNAAVDPTVLKFGLQQTLIKHPRFSSKLSINERKMKWTPTIVNLQDHVIIPKVDPKMDSPDQFVEDYVSRLTTIPTMDLSKPLWEIHILNIKTSNAQSICVFKIHHSIGDAVSLMSLLLASTRKKSDPKSLPTIPSRKRAGSNASNGFMWMKLRTIWNTFVDMILFGATILFLEDTKTSLKGSSSRVDLKPKRVVYRIVSLDDIKVVKTKMNITINDVMLGVIQAGLSRYLNHECGDNDQKGEKEKQKKINLQKKTRLRATLMVNLRPTSGIQSLETLMSKESKQKKWGWGNKFGYMVLPFETALQNEPLDYVRQAKATVDRKKDSLEALCSFRIATLIVNIFGAEVASAVAHRFISNTTMALSNVVGPIEEISFYGHPIQFLATTVYGHPHALTIHYQSYFNKMTIVVAVDPDVIPNPHKLCDHLEESLNIIKNAVLDKGFDAA
ncbi:wax ester synthase/diacylglycerol acyltransferase 11-like isoform X2 [Mercurialis annua]|uniref:wax ester synthase/diacylglycerol acyltransferase 11-like isoform X2 n=1 Tax=Mercurialis annua TaxID=3986 RepID=UPI00215EFAB9|nr:wax ester synthase/diacylglycerol acyltransferase 11-like isoform X2 [Mercurialis annua]